MTKKGGKSTRQINSHECPSELCLCFSPKKQPQPSARLQDRAGERGRARKKQPRQSRGSLSLVQARGQSPWGSGVVSSWGQASCKRHLCFPSSLMERLVDIQQECGTGKPSWLCPGDRNVTCRSSDLQDRQLSTCQHFPFLPTRSLAASAFSQWHQSGASLV